MGNVIEQLRAAVKRSKMNCCQLAKAANLERSALSRLMHGTRGLSLDSAEQLARVLGLELSLRPKGRKGR